VKCVKPSFHIIADDRSIAEIAHASISLTLSAFSTQCGVSIASKHYNRETLVI